MTDEKMSPLRQRMIEDMRIRGMGDKAQKPHIRAIKDFAAFLGRSPDTTTLEDLCAYQLHMTDAGVNRLHTFPIDRSKTTAASTSGSFTTRVVVASDNFRVIPHENFQVLK